MARTKTVDGKRVGMSAKFSEPEAAEIDAARGGTERGPWLREAALVMARGGPIAAGMVEHPPAPPPPEVAGEAIVAPERKRRAPAGRFAVKPPPVHDARVPVFQEAGSDVFIPPLLSPERDQPARPACKHPSALVEDNVCGGCGEEVDLRWLP